MKYYLLALKQYANFKGRANRSEYWYFMLFHVIFIIAAVVLDNVLGITFEQSPYGFIYALYAVAVFLPSLAVAVRRLHDVNQSGWVILVGLIPFIGGIWLLVLMVKKGTEGENKYGADPDNPEPSFDFEKQQIGSQI